MSHDDYESHNDPRHTAHHEAGHAVLQFCLNLGCVQVTIVPDHEKGFAGVANHGGEWPTDEDAEQLRTFAEEAFFLRHAIADYAGAEACRRAGYTDWRLGADDDYRNAMDMVNRITHDAESIRHLDAIARRRAVVLVEYYWPEIEAVATALLESKTLTGEDVSRIVRESLLARRGRLLSW